MASRGPLDISVVVPVYNEEDNVGELVDRVTAVMRATGYGFELIVIDDGSADQTLAHLRRARLAVDELRVVVLRRNFGQTAALQAGFDHARGRIIVTLDGDLQNDPADIPRLIAVIERGADVVSGWRRDRKDTLVMRKIPSILANSLIRWLTGVPVHDQGCSLKAYRREVVERLDLYSDMHRFITVLTMWNAAKIAEVEVTHHPRRAGISKYGIGRVTKVIADLCTIQMMTHFRDHPVRWFGVVAAPFLLASIVCLAAVPVTGVVMAAVSVIASMVCVSCACAGAISELILETANSGRDSLIAREELR